MSVNWNISDFIAILDLMVNNAEGSDKNNLCQVRSCIEDVKNVKDNICRYLIAQTTISYIEKTLKEQCGLTKGENCLLEKIATYLNCI